MPLTCVSVALLDFCTSDLTAVLAKVSRSLICQFPMIGDFESSQNLRFTNSESENQKTACNLSFMSLIMMYKAYATGLCNQSVKIVQLPLTRVSVVRD